MLNMYLQGNHRWTFARLKESLDILEVDPRGVLHIGAHLAREAEFYEECGFTNITFVEADPKLVDVLMIEGFPHEVINLACARERGSAAFYRAVDDRFSGIKKNSHKEQKSSFIVDTVPVRDIQNRMYNVLVVDTQGTELEVIESADLEQLDLLIVEVTSDPGGYAAPLDETVGYMAENGFAPRIRWIHEASNYWDILFRKDG